MKLIKNGPMFKGSAMDIESIRGITFSMLGEISLRAPHLFTANLDITAMLFTAVSSDSPNVRISVQKALSNVCLAYKPQPPAAMAAKIIEMLNDSVKHKEVPARMSAVKWANELFGLDNCAARWNIP